MILYIHADSLPPLSTLVAPLQSISSSRPPSSAGLCSWWYCARLSSNLFGLAGLMSSFITSRMPSTSCLIRRCAVVLSSASWSLAFAADSPFLPSLFRLPFPLRGTVVLSSASWSLALAVDSPLLPSLFRVPFALRYAPSCRFDAGWQNECEAACVLSSHVPFGLSTGSNS